MAQAVSRRPSTAEARARSRVSPCGICGGQSDNGTGFSAGTEIGNCIITGIIEYICLSKSSCSVVK
jgi:hypothetical protein